MRKRTVVILWLLLGGIGGALAVSVFAAIFHRLFPPDAPEQVFLPAESVEVEVVPQSFLDRLTVSEALAEGLRLENGELRDEANRLAQVVQTLSVQTEPVTRPPPPPVADILREDCPGVELPSFDYRAGFTAVQFEGRVDGGDQVAFGWKGWLRCEVDYGGGEWALLVDEPFTLENTRAATTAPPAPPRRSQRHYVGVQYALLTDSAAFDVSNFYDTSAQLVRFDPAAVRVYGGWRWFPKKRWTVRTGVFADHDSVGVDFGLDF